MTDIARLAVPQDDGYDAQVALELAQTTTSAGRPHLYSRRPVDGHPTIFDGRVALREHERTLMLPPKFLRAPYDHPNLGRATAYVARWPAAYQQFALLMDTLTPLYDGSIRPHRRGNVLGSCSHSEEREFGTMMATVEDPLGLAQAMVHELSHQKLRALGVSVESASRFIVNDPNRLFPSPVRYDRPRPMTAVFHAEYSFIHVVALDLRMLAEETVPAVRDRIVLLLARNVPRMLMGYDLLLEHLETDGDGKVFCDAFLKWAYEVLREGEQVLGAYGYGPPKLAVG